MAKNNSEPPARNVPAGQPRRISETDEYREPQPFAKIVDNLDRDFMLTHVSKRKGQDGPYYLLDCIDVETAETKQIISSHELLVDMWDDYARNPEKLPVIVQFFKRGKAFFVR